MQNKSKYRIIVLILGVLLISSLVFSLLETRKYQNMVEGIAIDTSFENTDENKRKMITEAMEKTLENMIEDHIELIEEVSIKINTFSKVSFVSVILVDYEGQKLDQEALNGIEKILINSISNLEEENIVMLNQDGERLK